MFFTAYGSGIELVGTVAAASAEFGTFVTAETTAAGASEFVAVADDELLFSLIKIKVAMTATITTRAVAE